MLCIFIQIHLIQSSFIFSYEVKNCEVMTFLKHAKSLLKRLTWTKHSTPDLKLLLWTTVSTLECQSVVHDLFSTAAHLRDSPASLHLQQWFIQFSGSVVSNSLQPHGLQQWGWSEMSHGWFWCTTLEAVPLPFTPESSLGFCTVPKPATVGPGKLQPNDLTWQCYFNTF